MVSNNWRVLPEPVRLAAIDKCGDVDRVDGVDVLSGVEGECFTAVLNLSDRTRVYCKGIQAARAGAQSARAEMWVAPWLPATFASSLLWSVETDGWLLLGFDHIPGRHADLSPGSPDLPLVAAMLTGLARELTPCPAPAISALGEKIAHVAAWRHIRDNPPAGLDGWTRDRLAILAASEPVAAELVAGDALVHTGMRASTVLVGDGSARAVTWTSPHRAAPWVDVAYVVLELIRVGHTPADAEQWASTVDVWTHVRPEAVTAFAFAVYGMLQFRALTDQDPPFKTSIIAARRWTRYRDGLTPGEEIHTQCEDSKPGRVWIPAAFGRAFDDDQEVSKGPEGTLDTQDDYPTVGEIEKVVRDAGT